MAARAGVKVQEADDALKALAYDSQATLEVRLESVGAGGVAVGAQPRPEVGQEGASPGQATLALCRVARAWELGEWVALGHLHEEKLGEWVALGHLHEDKLGEWVALGHLHEDKPQVLRLPVTLALSARTHA